MAGLVPTQPAPHSGATGSHVVFVPVDGRVVFTVCVLLVLACLVWVRVLWRKGVEADQ